MNILSAIGNTSLVQLGKVVPTGCAEIFVKLEWENPTGSMKDRMALGTLARAEQDGRLKRGGTVVEYTGGSTGTSLAMVCAAKGYRFKVVTSEAFSQEKRDHMNALGAELVLVTSADGLTTKKLILDMIDTRRSKGWILVGTWRLSFVTSFPKGLMSSSSVATWASIVPRCFSSRSGRLVAAFESPPEITIASGISGNFTAGPRHPMDRRSTQATRTNTIGTSITVVFCYPLTGRPGVSLPAGWDLIPGARGCTPQACSYRDSIGQLRKTGVRQVFGLSTQDTDYQREAANRLHLPFPLLSDELLQFATALSLPLLEVDELKLIKRLTMISSKGVIQKVFYPVFPPDQNVGDVMSWMRTSDGAALRRGEVLDEIG